MRSSSRTGGRWTSSPQSSESPGLRSLLSRTNLTSYLVSIPGKYLVESVPALLWLPAFLTPWRKLALEQRERDIAYYTRLVNEVKQKMKEDRAPFSFCKQLLETQSKTGMTDLEVRLAHSSRSGNKVLTQLDCLSQVAYTCGTPFGAGVDTSSGTLISFFLACAEFGKTFIPKAQEELDRVVGDDRLPAFEDFEDLPYIRAVVNETLRWRPIAVLGGTPHASTEDE